MSILFDSESEQQIKYSIEVNLKKNLIHRILVNFMDCKINRIKGNIKLTILFH